MKGLTIVVEGDSEKAFVDTVLAPYLYSNGLKRELNCFKIKHTKGGVVKYQYLKNDLINCVFEPNTILTTFIDYYALPEDFPKFKDAQRIVNKANRLSFLENAIIEDLEQDKKREFPNLMPYIQLHEFEALVFSSLTAFQNLYEPEEIDFEGLESVMRIHSNPEDINEGSETAPSMRLKSLIPGYNKIIEGNMIIDENGIEVILKTCPRFRSWIESILQRLAS